MNDISKSKSPPNVIAFRNEHLGEDWDAADKLLGGSGTYGAQTFQKKLNDNTGHKKAFLSEEAVAILCRVMCLENQYYKKILHQAVNLNAAQVNESIVELQALCPEQTYEIRTCTEVQFIPPSPVPEDD